MQFAVVGSEVSLRKETAPPEGGGSVAAASQP
jgi:hypothetical protein